MHDDLHWTPARLATLVEQVPASDASDSASAWSRFEFHAICDDECTHGVPLSSSASMIGSWPDADGTTPPLAIAQQLSDTLSAYQLAHTEATGGPSDGMDLYIRRHNALWQLAWAAG